MYSLKMAWRPQVLRWKAVFCRGVAWRGRIDKRFRSAARAGVWARIRQFFLRPSWKTLPLAMALVCVAAAIPAPAAARFVGWLLDIHWEQVFRNPDRMADFARLDGALEALCCYLFGILPLEYQLGSCIAVPRIGQPTGQSRHERHVCTAAERSAKPLYVGSTPTRAPNIAAFLPHLKGLARLLWFAQVWTIARNSALKPGPNLARHPLEHLWRVVPRHCPAGRPHSSGTGRCVGSAWSK